MFRKLQLRFIGLATLVVALILGMFWLLINSAVYAQTESNIQTVLSVLTDNDGQLPMTEEIKQDLTDKNIQEGIIYNFQYFSASQTKQSTSINLGNIQSLSENTIYQMAQKALKTGGKYGQMQANNRYFSYQISTKGQKRLVAFLETTNYNRERSILAQFSTWIALASLFFLTLIIALVSGIVIRPYIKSYEKQRIFITNAGHELKTPLAIIAANTELQEMMTGENEWTESTKAQTERLNKLIARLIRLSRMEEHENLELTNVNLSELIEKVGKDHSSLIQQENKHLELDVQPDLKAMMSEDEGYELISILLDNARKYCDEKGTIMIKAYNNRRSFRRKVRIEISNDYAAGTKIDYKRFFDRFYRAETSHNNQAVSGYGIGLSMAQHLTSLFKGRIWASYKKGRITFNISL